MHTSNIAGLADALNRIEARLDALEKNPVRLVDGLGTRIEQSGTDYAVHIQQEQLLEGTALPFKVLKGKNENENPALRINPESYAWTMPEGGGNIPIANIGKWFECVGAAGADKAACEAAGGKWTIAYPWIDLPEQINANGHLVYLELAFQDNSGGLLDSVYPFYDNALGAGNAKGKVYIADDFHELSEDEGEDGIYELHAGGSASTGYNIKYVRIPIALVTLVNNNNVIEVDTITQYRTTHVRLWAAGFDAVPALYPLD